MFEKQLLIVAGAANAFTGVFLMYYNIYACNSSYEVLTAAVIEAILGTAVVVASHKHK